MKLPEITILSRKWRSLPLIAIFLIAGYCCHAEMLLLQSGVVLEGDLTETAEEWVVTNPTGQVKVRKSDTLVRGQSAADLYAWQREQLTSRSATIHHHLRLADWCLGQSLWIEASRELLDARQFDPDSSQLRVLERRLMQMSQQPSEEEIPRVAPQAINKVELDWDAIEKSWKLAPEQTAGFSRRIQPLLVNNCTTSGCHRSGSENQYQLDISLRQGYGNAESTRRNLLSTLVMLNREDPANSLLLEAARGPHAVGKGLSGTHREAWIAMLESWVAGVAKANGLIETQTNEPANQEVIQVAQANKIQEEPIEDAGASVQNQHEPEQTFTPRDEFDPEIFNRLFRNSDSESN